MQLRFIYIVALLTVFTCTVSPQEKENLLEGVNKKVELLEKEIKELKRYNYFYFEYCCDPEVGKDIIEFYFEEKSDSEYLLRVAKISIAQEIWRNEFIYYFDEDGKMLKFINKAVGRPDNPPKRAIIFDKQGKIIWSNFQDKIPMNPEEIKRYFLLFKKQMEELIEKHGNYY